MKVAVRKKWKNAVYAVVVEKYRRILMPQKKALDSKYILFVEWRLAYNLYLAGGYI